MKENKKLSIKDAEETKVDELIQDIETVLPNMFRDIPSLSTVLGEDDKKDITLVDARIENTSFGEYAILTLGNNKVYRYSGNVVVKQVKYLIQEKKLPVRVHIRRMESPKGEYLSLN